MEDHLCDVIVVAEGILPVGPRAIQTPEVDHVRGDVPQADQGAQPPQELEVTRRAESVGEDLELGGLAPVHVDHTQFVGLVGRDVVENLDGTLSCLWGGTAFIMSK